MKKFSFCRFTVACLLLSVAVAFAITPAVGQATAQPATKPLDKKIILEKALHTYYILENQGLKSFQCVVQLDWKKFVDMAAEKPTSGDDPRLALLTPVQYSVAVDDQGNPKITPVMATGGTIDHSMDAIVAGAQRTILGFFQSWNSMVLASLFSPSEEDSYTMLEQPDGYKLTEVVGELTTELALTKEFVLTTMKSTAPGVIILIKPQYTKTEKGLLLMTGLDDDINNGSQKVNIQIQYQTVEGFQLPGKVSYQVTFSGQTIAMDLTFAKYQLTKR
jgi:hypothetical protein